MISVAASSDIHGSWMDLPWPPDANILALAGDLTSDGSLRNTMALMQWASQFTPYYDSVVMIPGNHDHALANMGSYATVVGADHGITLLIDSAADICGKRFWLSPWSLTHGKGSFMADEAFLERRFAEIPDDTQVIISHGPPKGTLDFVARNGGVHAGSQALAVRIAQLQQLEAIVFGHIHECGGRRASIGNAMAYNVAALDRSHCPRTEPWTHFSL